MKGDITVKDLSEGLGVKVGEVIKALMKLGAMATINQRLDINIAGEVAKGFNAVVVSEEKKAEEKGHVSEQKEEAAHLVTRPPIVVVMGHVDHGKTKLLDAIRKTNVIDTEAGGITQHIGAYQVEVKGKKVTFLDTPGHEAFTALRSRGAKVTDIAVLVVAADDGVMPQTIEAIDHAKAAGVPIIVALNKIDKPEANPEKVKKQLMEYDLTPEEWGGKTVTVPVSAKQGKGIDELLEMILLTADILELKANPQRQASGIVIEAKLDKGRGPVATVLIGNGTLRVGDNFYAGGVSGKVRALMNDKGERIANAPPSMPVEVLGAESVPVPGEVFRVAHDEQTARKLADKKRIELESERLQKGKVFSLADFSRSVKEGLRKDLNIILKADVQGSLEAIKGMLANLSTADVRVNIIHSGAGNISESDVMLALASKAIVVGFNVTYGGGAENHGRGGRRRDENLQHHLPDTGRREAGHAGNAGADQRGSGHRPRFRQADLQVLEAGHDSRLRCEGREDAQGRLHQRNEGWQKDIRRQAGIAEAVQRGREGSGDGFRVRHRHPRLQ